RGFWQTAALILARSAPSPLVGEGVVASLRRLLVKLLPPSPHSTRRKEEETVRLIPTGSSSRAGRPRPGSRTWPTRSRARPRAARWAPALRRHHSPVPPS